jgi:hypothetical protein
MFCNRPGSVTRWEEKVFPTWFFTIPLLLLDAFLFLTLHAVLSPGRDQDGAALGAGDSGTGGYSNSGVRATKVEGIAQQKVVL